MRTGISPEEPRIGKIEFNLFTGVRRALRMYLLTKIVKRNLFVSISALYAKRGLVIMRRDVNVQPANAAGNN
jgi:hypothetical protein